MKHYYNPCVTQFPCNKNTKSARVINYPSTFHYNYIQWICIKLWTYYISFIHTIIVPI